MTFLAVENSAAMNAYTSFCMDGVCFCLESRSRITGSFGNCMLNILKMCQHFPEWLHILHPH